MIAVEATLNGTTHHGEELKVDAPIKAIEYNPRVTLTKTNGLGSNTLIIGLLLWENEFGANGINKFIIHKQCK